MSILKKSSILETIGVTPSWTPRPWIQVISTDKGLFCQKADGQNGIRHSPTMITQCDKIQLKWTNFAMVGAEIRNQMDIVEIKNQ